MNKRLLYSTVAALMIFPAIAIAEKTEEQDIKTLDEVVVTATRAPKDIKKVPGNVTVISAEEIVDSGASSIVGVLSKKANIHIRTFSGNSSQAQIDLRGFGENGFGRTLVMVDGRRLNRLDLSSINWTQVPLEQIERIEVVRGSASVLYGDAAVAGVINIITKKGAVDPIISGGVQVGEDDFYDIGSSVVGSSDKFSYSAHAAKQKTDGWRDRTAFESYGGGFQLGYDVSDNLGISGGASYNKTDFDMPGALTGDELDDDREQAQPFHTDDKSENKYHKANLLVESSLGRYGDVEINLVYGKDEFEITIPSWWSFSDSDAELIGLQPKYILESDHGSFSNQLITGVDIYNQTLTVDKFAEESRKNKTHNTDLERDTVGWYVRDEISIGNKYILSGGFRIEKAEIEGRSRTKATNTVDFDEDKSHDGDVFELSATWLPKDNMKFYTKYSTVYRYPFIDEQASYYGFGSDTFLTHIEAEEGKSIDVGFEISPVKDISVAMNLYQIDMEDEISWNENTYRNENLDDTRHRGLEMFLKYVLEGVLDLSVSYTHQKTTFEDGPHDGNEVPLVPRNLFTANLDLTLPYNFHLIPTLQYVDESYLSQDFDNNEEKLDDYTVVDILLRYKRNIGKTELTAFMKVANVFDEEYSTTGTDGQWWGENTYYPSPDRKFYGGISARF
jgi:iron complex outermembrane receptor protein